MNRAASRPPSPAAEPAAEQAGEQAGAAATGAQPEDAQPEEAQPEEAEPLYAEPLAVQRERRRLWLEGRDCALRLAEAGVPFAFGSGGGDAKKLVGKVRELVEAGLDAELALAALTETAAQIVEVPGVLGALEPGCDATFAVWSEHPLRSKKAKLAALFVDGEPYEFELDGEPELEGEPAQGVDLSGRWTLAYEGGGQSVEMRLELEMQPDGELEGTFEREDPTGAMLTGELGGKVAGRQVRFEGSYTLGEAAVEFVFDGALEGAALEGRMHVEGAFGELDADAHGERSPDARGAEGRR